MAQVTPHSMSPDQAFPESNSALMYTSPESQHSSDRSPLSNFGFLKNLGLDKKQTKDSDGAPPKRRGPKPDSKPALTRRQELNRQAQRTHRERKEMYIKALEQEVLRLKELYASSVSDRDTVVMENKRFRELLIAHGIPLEGLQSLPAMRGMPASYNGSSSGSISGSYGQESSAGFSPPPLRSHDSKPMASASQLPTQHVDYDQIGIDFVLTLERPCMGHMQYLVVRSHNPDGQPHHHPMERPDDVEYEHMSGHALMASCPPASHIMHSPGEPYGHKMPDMKTPDLMKLLDLSAQLPLEGELTPVMAWMMLLRNSRVAEMTAQDFELVKTDLAGKVRCYGFGAVLEEFEVRDALSNLFIAKENMVLGQVHMPQQIEAY